MMQTYYGYLFPMLYHSDKISGVMRQSSFYPKNISVSILTSKINERSFSRENFFSATTDPLPSNLLIKSEYVT